MFFISFFHYQFDFLSSNKFFVFFLFFCLQRRRYRHCAKPKSIRTVIIRLKKQNVGRKIIRGAAYFKIVYYYYYYYFHTPRYFISFFILTCGKRMSHFLEEKKIKKSTRVHLIIILRESVNYTPLWRKNNKHRERNALTYNIFFLRDKYARNNFGVTTRTHFINYEKKKNNHNHKRSRRMAW